MNNAKICVPVCAGTRAEMAAKISEAEEFADITELRFDCLDPSEQTPANFSFTSSKPLLFTFRPMKEGGGAPDDKDIRLAFWKALMDNPSIKGSLVDLETDIVGELNIPNARTIVSIHDFSGVPDDIDAIFDRMGSNGEIVKIAVQANGIGDSISAWDLIKRAGSQRKDVIPVAMGDAGKWTRILGPAQGSFLTYASLESGSETAPGQISAKELIEVYRVRDLDPATKVYGIIGDPISQSLSPYMHNPAFAARGINAVFVPFLVDDLDAFVTKMLRRKTSDNGLDIGGLSVTMPHKQSIMKYLDEIDETGKRIGAVNTIKVEDEKLIGYNTDAYGFITPLKQAFPDLKDARVAIVGAGGAARACIYALKNEGASVTLFARDPKKAQVLADDFKTGLEQIPDSHNRKGVLANFDILVDATPYGMGSLEDETLFTAEQLSGVKLVYDLVTKLHDTPLIRASKRAGARTIGGLEMLVAQGVEQFRIWTGKTVSFEEMRDAALARRF